jgi:hypothetical protein
MFGEKDGMDVAWNVSLPHDPLAIGMHVDIPGKLHVIVQNGTGIFLVTVEERLCGIAVRSLCPLESHMARIGWLLVSHDCYHCQHRCIQNLQNRSSQGQITVDPILSEILGNMAMQMCSFQQGFE